MCEVVFCGEWRRVSFRGGGGGVKGEFESALELGVVVVCFLFLGGGAGGQSASGL